MMMVYYVDTTPPQHRIHTLCIHVHMSTCIKGGEWHLHNVCRHVMIFTRLCLWFSTCKLLMCMYIMCMYFLSQVQAGDGLSGRVEEGSGLAEILVRSSC